MLFFIISFSSPEKRERENERIEKIIYVPLILIAKNTSHYNNMDIWLESNSN